jgi:hypothetical protein
LNFAVADIFVVVVITASLQAPLQSFLLGFEFVLESGPPQTWWTPG